MNEKLAKKFLHRVPTPLPIETIEQIRKTFDFFDFKANGKIEVNELRRILQALNMKKNDEECAEMIEENDLDGDGQLDFHEFLFALTRMLNNLAGGYRSALMDDGNQNERKRRKSTTNERILSTDIYKTKSDR